MVWHLIKPVQLSTWGEHGELACEGGVWRGWWGRVGVGGQQALHSAASSTWIWSEMEQGLVIT